MLRKISPLLGVTAVACAGAAVTGSVYALCAAASTGQPRLQVILQETFASERQAWEQTRNAFQEASNRGDASRRLTLARHLVELSQKIKDVNLVARSYHNLGQAFQAQGDAEANQKRSGTLFYHEATTAYSKALELADQVTASDLQAALLIRSNSEKGDAHFALGEDALAETHWLKSLEAAKEGQNPGLLATLINNLGSLFWKQKRLDTKLEFFENYNSLFKTKRMPECAAWCAYYHAAGALPEKRIAELKTALVEADAFDPAQSSVFRVTALHQLGLVYGEEGLFEEVVDTCSRAEQIWQNRRRLDPNENVEILAECRNNKARAYLNLGELQLALNEFVRALSLKPKEASNTDFWNAIERNQTLTKLAVDAQRGTLDLSQAEAISRQALRSQQLPSHSPSLGEVIILAGLALRRGDEARVQGQPAKARKIFQQALDFLEKDLVSPSQESGPGSIGLKRLFQGVLQLEQGQSQQAVAALSQAEENLDRSQNRSALGFCLSLLGVALDRAGQTQKAEETFSQAITQFEERQSRVATPYRLGPFQAVQAPSLYADYADLLARSSHPEKAVLMADRARGRGLAQQALSLFAEGNAAEQKKRWLEPLNTAELHRLTRAYPDTLFLHYNLGRDKTTLFTFGKGLPVKRLSLGVRPPALTRQIDAWIQNLTVGGSGLDEARQARELGKTLMGPLYTAKLLSTRKGATPWHHLVIIPDGALHNVPFAALMLPEGGTVRLVDRLPVTLSTSLRQLVRKVPFRQPKKGTLMICDPTRGAGIANAKDVAVKQGSLLDPPLPSVVCQAVELLARRNRATTTALVGKQARENDVCRLLSDYALLLFVTHGHAREEKSGLASYLTLAPENGSEVDGHLDAGEILKQPLSARMAFLMACETAQGRLAGGEGSQGLVWAFWAAGCPSVSASLWTVNSEACGKLLVAFWDELQMGLPKDEALRRAMLNLRKSYPNPVDWAAFQVYGSPEPTVEFLPSPSSKK